MIQNATPFLKIKQLTLLKYSNQNSIYSILNKVPVRNKLRRKITLKVWGWLRKVKFLILVNNQCTLTKFSAVIYCVMTYWIPKIQLICIIYAWISHNSKVINDVCGKCYSGKISFEWLYSRFHMYIAWLYMLLITLLLLTVMLETEVRRCAWLRMKASICGKWIQSLGFT